MRLFLAILCAISLAFIPLEAPAISNETQVGSTFTMDGVQPGSSGAWRSSQASSIKVESDLEGNTVLKMPSKALLAFTAFSNASPVRKSTVQIKLPTINDEGEVRLFCYNNTAQTSNNSNTTPIVLKNGGAYVADYDEYGSFINDGTLKADTWYTVERVFDFRRTGVNMQRAAIYDENDSLVGMSPWTCSGQMTSSGAFPTLYFETVDHSEFVQLDNLKLYRIDVNNVQINPAFLEQNNSFEVKFSEALDVSTVNKDSIKLSVNNQDYEQVIEYTLDYIQSENMIVVNYDRLPFSEAITLELTNLIRTADNWLLSSNNTFSFSTKEDPLYCEAFTLDQQAMKTDINLVLKNEDDTFRQCLLAMFLRNENNSISNIKAVRFGLNAGQTQNFTESFQKESVEQEIQVYLWNNWLDMIPIRTNGTN